MARLIKLSDDYPSSPSMRKSTLGSSLSSSRDLRSFVKTHDFPLHLPKLSIPMPRDVSPEVETVMLLSLSASKRITEAKAKESTSAIQGRSRITALDSMLKPHLCESGSISQRQIRALPTDFEEVLQYHQCLETRRSYDTSLSSSSSFWNLPFNRKDAELLIQWLDEMLEKLVSMKDLSIVDLFRYAQSIYSICFDETLRQVGVYCRELGLLVERVWKAYLGLLEKALTVSKVELARVEGKYAKEEAKMKQEHSLELESERLKVSDLSSRCTTLSKQVSILETQLSETIESEQTLKSKYMLLQSVYEDTKMSNLVLKEDVRVLKIKLANANHQLEHADSGLSDMTPTPVRRVRLRSDRELSEGWLYIVLKADAFLTPYGTGRFQTFSEMIIANSTNHIAKNEQKVFNSEDFCDRETNTAQEIMIEVDTQTDSLESGYIEKRQGFMRRVAVDAQGQISEYERLIASMADRLFEEYRVLDDDLNAAMKEIREKIDYSDVPEPRRFTLKDLAARVGQTHEVRTSQTLAVIQEEVDRKAVSLVQILYTELTQAFAKRGTMPDLCEDPAEIIEASRFTRRSSVDIDGPGRRLSKVRGMRFNQTYQITAQNIIGKVNRTPAKQLKNIMLKRQLLRLISQFFDEKLASGREHENVRQMSLDTFMYTQLLKKYGLQKVADGKYEQVVSSCLKYKSHPKVCSFARFLGLFDPISSVDLEYYLNALEKFKEFTVTQTRDVAYVALSQVLNTAKTLFEHKISSKDFFVFQKEIQSLEVISGDLTPLEPVLMIFMRLFRVEKDSLRSFVQYIYDAADVSFIQLNHDGLLELSEYLLLARHLSAREVSEVDLTRLFEDFADLSTSGSEEHCNAVSFTNFAELSFSQQLFTQDSFYRFVKANSVESIEKQLQDYVAELDRKAVQVQWRLKQLDGDHANLLERYFRTILERVKEANGDPQPLWIAIRIVEEETKEELAGKTAEKWLPGICRVVLQHL